MSFTMGVPPAGGDVNRASSLIAISCSECAVSLIIIGLRIWARLSVRALGIDDLLMLLAGVIFAVET